MINHKFKCIVPEYMGESRLLGKQQSYSESESTWNSKERYSTERRNFLFME